ncbi:NAD-dependent protein deacetylase sirtuin-1 [Euwallacea similis]|uniref:NAD-dependent protein deacetylase sirtuin-1 n=1 Tax=Euwallacea similis TaxID=1736056 RepID=UPI003450A6D1
MDSNPDVQDYESCAKRLKIDHGESDDGDLCKNQGLSRIIASNKGSADIVEGSSSGHEASTVESTHSSPPHTDSCDVPETASNFFDADNDQLDTLQEEDDDDNASTVSHLSELSGISNLSGQDWKPMAGSVVWIQQQMQKGINPRIILTELGVDLEQIPPYVDDLTLWKIIINILAEPPKRNKLRHVNTLDDVVRLLRGAQKVIVLTGAGVSVSCGIPDFRSRDGIYSRLAVEFPDLPNPQAMFDINYFTQDPRPFFKFAKDIYPGKFKPSPCHRFIKLLEKQQKLLRNYTQNIDTLEKEADIERVIECHGSFATATCTKCEHKVSADKIRELVLSQKIPLCEVCHGERSSIATDDFGSEAMQYKDLVLSGIMKPDIVFFGEGLPDTFHEAMAADKSECDLLVVIGSSLKVRPVALIPSSLSAHVPQILINREPLSHCHFDVELLGDCDVIINHLCKLLGQNWEEAIYTSQELTETSELLPCAEPEPFDISKWRDNSSSLMGLGCTEETVTISDVVQVHSCTCESKVVSSPGSSRHECTCIAESKSHKERHISIDSARDSGIGDNSNFTDPETENSKEAQNSNAFSIESASGSFQRSAQRGQNMRKQSSDSGFEGKRDTMKGFWQPKVKKSLAQRLPPNTFHLLPPSRYVFPGAEVYYDPEEKSSCLDENSSSDDGMSECC